MAISESRSNCSTRNRDRAADDIYDKPDSVLYMPVPEGTGKDQTVSETFVLPENVACAFLRVGGTHFSGECWVEAPRLTQDKKVVCSIPFTKFTQKTDDYNYWIAVTSQPVAGRCGSSNFNGETLFEGNIFDRASNVADFYIPLPSSLQGSGEMKLTLRKEPHRAAYPYELRGLEIIEETARDFEVVSVPEYVAKNASFGILVETNKPSVSLKVKANGAARPPSRNVCLKSPVCML